MPSPRKRVMRADSGAADPADNDAEGWLADVLGHLERHGLTGNRLLDVGCGTGRSLPPMLARGWQVTGCDVSAAMIERARGRVGGAARRGHGLDGVIERPLDEATHTKAVYIARAAVA